VKEICSRCKNLANFRLEFNKEQEEVVATTRPMSKQTTKVNYGIEKNKEMRLVSS
jgi:hypothetical protein